MSVLHIVWIRFNPDVSSDRREEHIAALKTLPDSIPDISGMTIGENFTARADGCTHGLVIELKDKAALEAYVAHPRHIEVGGTLKKDAHLLVMDYEA